MCTTPCSGSSQQSCGGNNAINVYGTGLEWKTDTIGNYYLGCFEESENNRIFNSYSKSFSTNTPEFCSNICYTNGYAYSGVTYKSGCFCGNQPPNESKFTKVEDKQCNTKCSGDANQFCGGGWKMGVFATGLIGEYTNVLKIYSNCYKLLYQKYVYKKKIDFFPQAKVLSGVFRGWV